jgi:hypothetical protein
MASSIDEIKAKIAKMMAKEESARELGNQEEAESFAAKIQELLLSYELSIDDILRKEADSVTVLQEQLDTGPLTNRHESNWVVYLYNACAKTNFCKVIIVGGSGSTWIKVVGTKMNIEFLHFMVHQLIPKIRTLSRKSFADYVGPEKRNTFVRGWLKGCCNGIQTKLALQRRLEADTNAQVYGLVIQKDRAVNDFVERTFGRLGVSKGKAIKGRDGYVQGKVYGQEKMDVSIKKDRGAGGTKLLGQ